MTVFSKNYFLSLLSLAAFIVLTAIASFIYGGSPGSKADVTESSGWQRLVASWEIIADYSFRNDKISPADQTNVIDSNEINSETVSVTTGWLTEAIDKIQAEWKRGGDQSGFSYPNIKENIWEAARLVLDKVLMRN